MIFGKKLSEYCRFQQAILWVIGIVGVAKLALSLAGMPNDTTKWLSISVLAIAGTLYYGVRVHTSGFGSYKQLLPLIFNQGVLSHGIVAIGIVVGILTGRDNIFTAPEYSGGGDGKTWLHVGAHVVLGMFVGALIGWLVACFVMWVTKKVAPRPVPAGA
jgi:small basic protein